MPVFSCECGDTFETKAGLSSHERYCEESGKMVDDQYECKCGETFKNTGHYYTHRNFCDYSDQEPDYDLNREKVECPDCGSMVADTQLENHRGSKTCENGGTFKSLKLNKNNDNCDDSTNTDINETGLTFRDFEKTDSGYRCFKCKEIYSKSGIVSHYWQKHTEEGRKYIENKGKNISPERFKTNNFQGKCKHCGKVFHDPQQLGGHTVFCKNNPRHDKICKKVAETQKERTLSEERKERISDYMQKAVEENPESYSARNVLKRIKKPKLEKNDGEVVKFDSGWELEVAQWLNKNNINWNYNIGKFKYKWNDSLHFYFPDFFLPKQDVYLEVKGYEHNKERNRCK